MADLTSSRSPGRLGLAYRVGREIIMVHIPLGYLILIQPVDPLRIRKGRKNERTATLADVLVVGAGQAIATCPGISRSGMTICMGCFRGMERRFAVRFAFLLSIPAVLGANILQIFDVVETGVNWSLLPAYLLGVAAAGLSGYLSIRLVRMVADKGKFGSFAYYCWIAGVVTVVLSLLKALNLLPWLAA